MLRVQQPPEHVRIKIEARKIKEEQAALELGKLFVKNPSMLSQNGARLLQIFLVVEHAIGQRFRVLRNSLRVKFTSFIGQQSRITGWSRDGQRRIRWVHIDRRNVKLKSRMRLFKIKAAHAFHVAKEWKQL